MHATYTNGMYESQSDFKCTLTDVFKLIQKDIPTFQGSYANNYFGTGANGLVFVSPEEAFKQSGLKSFQDAFNGKRDLAVEALFDRIAAPYKIENDPVKVVNWRPSGISYNNFNKN